MSNYCVCCPRSNKDYPGSKTNESLDLYLLFFLIIFPLCRWHRSLQHPHSVIFLLWYSQYTVVFWLTFASCSSFKPCKFVSDQRYISQSVGWESALSNLFLSGDGDSYSADYLIKYSCVTHNLAEVTFNPNGCAGEGVGLLVCLFLCQATLL